MVLALALGTRSEVLGSVWMTCDTDNQGNGFLSDKPLTTEYPLGIVLMEAACRLGLCHAPPGTMCLPLLHSDEADALAENDFRLFVPSKRIWVRRAHCCLAHSLSLAWGDREFDVSFALATLGGLPECMPHAGCGAFNSILFLSETQKHKYMQSHAYACLGLRLRWVASGPLKGMHISRKVVAYLDACIRFPPRPYWLS